MKHLALILCFALSFGFIESSQRNEEKLPYVLMIKFGTKKDAEAQFLVIENASLIIMIQT